MFPLNNYARRSSEGKRKTHKNIWMSILKIHFYTIYVCNIIPQICWENNLQMDCLMKPYSTWHSLSRYQEVGVDSESSCGIKLTILCSPIITTFLEKKKSSVQIFYTNWIKFCLLSNVNIIYKPSSRLIFASWFVLMVFPCSPCLSLQFLKSNSFTSSLITNFYIFLYLLTVMEKLWFLGIPCQNHRRKIEDIGKYVSKAPCLPL